MNENLVTIKSTIAAFLMAAATFLGWKGIMLTIWVGVMALDYLSGTLAACREGQWCSSVARQGLWHKGGMILVVTVSAISDGVMLLMMQIFPLGMEWPGLILPLVLAWYILTELGSILENAVKMGAKTPQWMIRFLKAGIGLTEQAGESMTNSMETPEENRMC